MLFQPGKNNVHEKKRLYEQPALDNIGLDEIKPEQNYHFFGNGKISLHEVISKVLYQTVTCDLLLSTWSLSSPAMKALINLRSEGLIKNACAVVDYRAPKDHADAFGMALNFFDPLAITPNHSKIVVLDNSVMPVAIAGSANLTNNPKEEYFLVSTDSGLTSYFKAHIQSLIEKGDPAV